MHGKATYGELRKIIKDNGLLEKQPYYYLHKIATALICVIAGFVFFVFIDALWLKALCACFLGFAFCQICFLAHDSGHRQIFKSVLLNDIMGLISNFLVGISINWWINQHNEHHTNPNNLDLDPHTRMPILAFSKEKAEKKRGLTRFLIRFQALYFIPLVCLSCIELRMGGFIFLFKNGHTPRQFLEVVLVTAHISVYCFIIFYFSGFLNGILFIAIHQMVFGLYVGSVFAPNHKGMPTSTKNNGWDFLHLQILTTRNIKPNPIVDFLYGGTSYQIEHHLFPNMPRNNLGKAKKIVESFCNDNDIKYHETSVARSWIEILSDLHTVGSSLRGNKKALAINA